jgi:hypothetical protein
MMITGQKEEHQPRAGRQEENVEQLMNEIGRELGVHEKTRSPEVNPNQLAEQIKQEIKKRT